MSDPSPSKRSSVWRAATVLGALALLATGGVTSAQTSGGYTQAQAIAGQQLVYASRCATCHGVNLQGGAGPALTGPAFKTTINAEYKTAGDLYRFISVQMPADAPGTLTSRQYLDVTAFVLSRNGYKAGKTPLTVANADKVKLAAARSKVRRRAAPALEIDQSAPPITKVFSGLPPGANVSSSDSMFAAAPTSPADWLVNGRTYANDRYSPLTQVDTTNVASLTPVAIVQTGFTASFEATPIVVNGVMYVSTPVVNNQMKILALNAATGSRIWETTYTLTQFLICCGPVNRGVVVAYGYVYFLTLDDRLVALDARTGKFLWRVKVADPTVGYSETMTPQVYDGMILIGSAGGEWAISGFDAAYNARTGKQIWRWSATDPKTFAGSSYKSGGGMNWTTPALDTKLGLLIFSTGNPNPDLYGNNRKGDNLYTDSIVALDVHTGKLRWYYQEVKHDLWDYDATSNVVLFDVRANGRTIPAAGQAGKVGWFFIVDRRTGKLLRKSQPFVLQNKNMFATKRVLPGANGGSEWSPPAYSPQTHNVYVLGINQLMDFKISPAADHPGFAHTGSVFTNVTKPKIQTGTFTAIDVDSGRISWQYKAPKPMIGGALATGGGLVFVGEGNGQFNAFDASSGKKLWHYTFVGGANAPPVSYEVNGTQYVAVAAGGNYQLNYERDDTVGIFALKR